MMLQEVDSQKPLNTDNLKLLHITAQHLDDLVRDVLVLAHDEVGELRLVCEPLELAKVLNQVEVVGEGLAREHGLGWHVEIPAGLPQVWGDPTRLRQVVLNLINNAIWVAKQGEIGLQVLSAIGHVYCNREMAMFLCSSLLVHSGVAPTHAKGSLVFT